MLVQKNLVIPEHKSERSLRPCLSRKLLITASHHSSVIPDQSPARSLRQFGSSTTQMSTSTTMPKSPRTCSMAFLLLGRPAEHAVVTLPEESLGLTIKMKKLVAEMEKLTCGKSLYGRGRCVDGAEHWSRWDWRLLESRNQTQVMILAIKSSHVLLLYPRQSP